MSADRRTGNRGRRRRAPRSGEQHLVGTAAGGLAEQVEIAHRRHEREVQALTNRVRVEPERQAGRRTSKIRAERLQCSYETADVVGGPALDDVEIDGDVRRAVRGRREPADDDEFDACLRQHGQEALSPSRRVRPSRENAVPIRRIEGRRPFS